METDLEYFSLFPLVVEEGVETTLTLSSVDCARGLHNGEDYVLEIHPMAQRLTWEGPVPTARLELHCESRQLHFTHTFHREQQYNLVLFRKGEDRPLTEQSVYCLAGDLFALTPLRGCLHCHSDYSDGLEAPMVVAACYRQAGYDFMTVTDHGMYEPSLEARDLCRELAPDFPILPGEEIHAPGNRVHIIGFGHSASVNELFRQDPEGFRREVEDLCRTEGLPKTEAGFEYGASLWIFRKIRELGGVSMLCHPSWIEGYRYNIPADLYRRFLEEGPFDLLELINGGNTPWEQADQVSQWCQAAFDGHFVPVVGTDDSHGAVNGRWFHIGSAYVFAASREPQELVAACKAGRTVALEQRPGEAPHFYGPQRLVQYAVFLHRFYFPRHDDICREEGRLLLEVQRGNAQAAADLAALRDRVPAFTRLALGRG